MCKKKISKMILNGIETQKISKSISDENNSSKHRMIQAQQLTSPTKIDLYEDLPAIGTSGLFASSLSTKLGLPLPNPAPDIG